MFGNMIANTFINPFQAPVFDDPKNYGLEYENVNFCAEDGVELSGWLIKGSSNKVIIQSHFGVQCSRAGYTREGKGIMKFYPRDIHFLRQAKYLNDAGYTVLMYDFRNHGNSHAGTMPYISWGEQEAKDVVAAVNFITTHPTYKAADIGLLSICMGQGASITAFHMDEGLKNVAQIKTMISVQPMDYGCFVHAMGLPEFMIKSTDKAIRKRTGKDYNQTSWRPFVKDVTVPTLIIQNKNDGYLDADFVESVYADLCVEKELLWIDIPKMKGGAAVNRGAAYEWLGENPEDIIAWFAKYLAQSDKIGEKL